MSEDRVVHKGYHCAWQIHYHIVFPVKYRKSLLDEEVVRIIQETVVGIEERYEIEFEALGIDNDHSTYFVGLIQKYQLVGLYRYSRV